jgi:hypothetical protein
MSDVLNNDDMHALAAEYVLGTLEADERVRAHAMLDVDHGFRAMVRIWERRFSELHLMVEPVDPPPQIWDRIKAQLPAITPPPSEPGAAAPAAQPAAAASVSPASEGTPAEAEETPAEAAAPAAVPPEAVDQPRTAEGTPVLVAETEGEQGPDVSTFEPAVAETEEPIPVPRPVALDRAGGTAAGAWRALALVMSVLVLALLALGAAWKFSPQRLPAAVQSLFQPNGGIPPPSARRLPPAFEE